MWCHVRLRELLFLSSDSNFPVAIQQKIGQPSFILSTLSPSINTMPLFHADCSPTLPELILFKIKTKSVNILTEIGSKYQDFGILLLKDDKGAKIEAMVEKHGRNDRSINGEIFREWLQGRGAMPVSWRTLIDTLNDIGLSTLANNIKTTLQ